jgi:hypothetical protein
VETVNEIVVDVGRVTRRLQRGAGIFARLLGITGRRVEVRGVEEVYNGVGPHLVYGQGTRRPETAAFISSLLANFHLFFPRSFATLLLQ